MNVCTAIRLLMFIWTINKMGKVKEASDNCSFCGERYWTKDLTGIDVDEARDALICDHCKDKIIELEEIRNEQ